MEVADLNGLSRLAKKYNLKLVVDNTFSPLSISPVKFGADIVVHSLTKFINGASDTVGGVVCANKEFIDSCRNVNNGANMLLGPVMDSLRAANVLKNIRTLHIRMKKHSENALYPAKKFEEDGLKVIYPGLESHPQHELAKKQMRAPGAMIAFELKGGFDAGVKLMNYFASHETPMELAVSLGSVITYIEHPASMTHGGIPEEDRLERGITDSLVRLSVGAEGFTTLRDALDVGLHLAQKSEVTV